MRVDFTWLTVVAVGLAACAQPGGPGSKDAAVSVGVDLAGRDLYGVDLYGWDKSDLATSLTPDLAKPRFGIAATGTWMQVASPADSLSGAKNSTWPDLALYQGRPAMAWVESGQVRVATWNSGWSVLGNALGGTTAAYGTQLDGTNDQLHVGFFELPSVGAAHNAIYVYHWSGTTYDAVGAAVDQGLTYLPDLSLVVDSGGKPIIAWTAQVGGSSGHSEIVAQRFDGASWMPYGIGLHAESATSSALSAHLAIDTGDHVFASWQETFVHVYRSSLSTFAPVGLNSGKIVYSGSSTSSYETRLCVDSQGRPVVGWMEYSGGSAGIYVDRWSGTDWTSQVSPALSAQPGSTNSQIAAITTDGVDAPVVVWQEPDASSVSRLYVARIASGVGTLLGQPLALPSGYQNISFATVVVDGNDVPMVAFAAQKTSDSTYQLFVYRYL